MTDKPTVRDIVMDELRNRYLSLPRAVEWSLAGDITHRVLEHLHETGALSCPPEDLK